MGKSSRARRLAKEVRIEEKRSERLNSPKNKGFLEKKVFHALLITVIALCAYSNTFHSPFQLDDGVGIVNNNLLRDLDNFISNTKGYNDSPSRFMGHLTFALNYHVGGLSVTGYHVVNLAIHIANALLVYFLVLLIFRTPVMRQVTDPAPHTPVFVALFSALLFVSHPLHTQAVTYIVQRLASLATLFYLLSLVMYIKARLTTEKIKSRFIFYSLFLLFAVCAIKTKEIAFTLPATVVLCEFMFFKSSVRRKLLFLLLVMLTLPIIPLSLLHSDQPLTEMLSDVSERTRMQTDIPRWDYLMTQIRVITTYLRLVFVPIHQNVDYDYPIYHSLFTPPVFLSLFLLLSIAGSALYLLYVSRPRDPYPSSRSCYRLISFGVFWFFITLSVESSIIPIEDVIFEHRVYLPSVGLFIAIMTCIVAATKRIKTEKVTLFLLVLPVLLLTGITYARNTVWKSQISLWEDVVEKSPNKARPHNTLGWEYTVKGRLDEASKEYQTVLRLNPNFSMTHNNLGTVYFKQGRLDEALREFQAALRLDPNYFHIHYNLGTIYVKQGRLDEALKEYQAALKLDPDHAGARHNLAILSEMAKGKP